MAQKKEIPVYLFTGFLEAGKTRLIQETMEDERFNAGESTLIVLCIGTLGEKMTMSACDCFTNQSINTIIHLP